jgi:signal transduction histidine kinase
LLECGDVLKQVERRQRFLAELSRAFAGSGTDLSAVLELAARQTAEFLGDACGIRLPSDDGLRLEPAGFHMRDAKLEAYTRRLLTIPSSVDAGIEGLVFRTGRPYVMREVDRKRLRDSVQREHLRALDRVTVTSVMVFPLRTPRGILGTLGVARLAPRAPYTSDEQELVEAVAERAAFAIENARLYRETQEQLAAIQDALRVRDEFLASVSHDLRTPLAAIKGYVQLLQRQAGRAPTLDSERVQQRLGEIDLATTRVIGLVSDLLDLTRLESGRALDLALAETDLVALAREVVRGHQRLAPHHRLGVESGTPELVVMVDRERVERILSNLIGNAVKYSPEGSAIPVKLRPMTSDGTDWAEVLVSDEGIGIPKADLPYVFERFYRAGNVAGFAKGSGIGLATVKQLVDQHGGTVGIESAEGSGTTVTVLLPIRPPG